VPTGEPQINAALAEVLNGMRKRWRAQGEALGTLTGTTGHPDVLIIEPGVAPVVVESEVVPAVTVELDALSRLGATVRKGSMITSVLALRLPIRFRDVSDAQLRDQLRAAKDLEYALLSGTSRQLSQRFPSHGWLVGSVEDLAFLIYDAAIPEPVIDVAATRLQDGVTTAAGLLGQTI
jgi:hypothetical protein